MDQVKFENCLPTATVPHGMIMPGPLGIQTNHGPLSSASQSSAQPLPTNGTQQPSLPGSGLMSALPQSDSLASAAGSAPSAAQSTSPTAYFGDQAPSATAQSQQISANDGQMGNSHVPSPISPHLQSQQNGYPVTGNGANAATAGGGGAVSGNAQLQSYAQQQPPAPSNGSQGTWTGQNTLSYTQSIQPSDPRATHNSYCE